MSLDQDQSASACPNCGNHIDAGASFCMLCGRAVGSGPGPSSTLAAAPVPAPVEPAAPLAAPAPPPEAPAPPEGFTQPPAYGQPPALQEPPGYVPVVGYPDGYSYAPPPVRRNSATPVLAALAIVGLVVVVGAGAVLMSSGSHAAASPSAIALATTTATPTAVPTDTPTPEPTDTPTPEPTIEPTPAGTDWATFIDYASAQLAVKSQDIKTWNAASDPIKTRLAVNKTKADAKADLAWLQAHPPMDCYLKFYNELVLYDNQLIKAMDDWLAGRYTVLNKSDVPALNATWNLFSDEISDAQAACG